MDFKQWFNLMESVVNNDGELRLALTAYQNNPDDESAEEKFYKEVENYVKFWCLGGKCDRAGISAEELASDVTEKLLRKMREAGFMQSLDADRFPKYLSTITGNLRIDASRRKASRDRLSGVSMDTPMGDFGYDLKSKIPSGQISSEEEQMGNEMKEIVRKAIASLEKPSDRELADLIYYQDMTYINISEKLGIPLSTVKNRAVSLKEKLKAALEGVLD